jgi:hypothetical protein
VEEELSCSVETEKVSLQFLDPKRLYKQGGRRSSRSAFFRLGRVSARTLLLGLLAGHGQETNNRAVEPQLQYEHIRAVLWLSLEFGAQGNPLARQGRLLRRQTIESSYVLEGLAIELNSRSSWGCS